MPLVRHYCCPFGVTTDASLLEGVISQDKRRGGGVWRLLLDIGWICCTFAGVIIISWKILV